MPRLLLWGIPILGPAGKMLAGLFFASLALIRPLESGHNMTPWGVGERGVSPDVRLRPAFIAAVVPGVAPAGVSGGRGPGPLARD